VIRAGQDSPVSLVLLARQEVPASRATLAGQDQLVEPGSPGQRARSASMDRGVIPDLLGIPDSQAEWVT